MQNAGYDIYPPCRVGPSLTLLLLSKTLLLLCYCTALHCYCTTLHCSALLLHCYCTAIALLLHCYCTALHCYCTAIALLLHCYCTAIDLLLHCSLPPTQSTNFFLKPVMIQSCLTPDPERPVAQWRRVRALRASIARGSGVCGGECYTSVQRFSFHSPFAWGLKEGQ